MTQPQIENITNKLYRLLRAMEEHEKNKPYNEETLYMIKDKNHYSGNIDWTHRELNDLIGMIMWRKTECMFDFPKIMKTANIVWRNIHETYKSKY